LQPSFDRPLRFACFEGCAQKPDSRLRVESRVAAENVTVNKPLRGPRVCGEVGFAQQQDVCRPNRLKLVANFANNAKAALFCNPSHDHLLKRFSGWDWCLGTVRTWRW
jgi:hypothetical protein